MRIEGVKRVMSQLFPESSKDESDPREDENESKRREEEIQGDKPPHHDD